MRARNLIAAALAAAVLLALVARPLLRRSDTPPGASMPVDGGDAGGLPRALPQDEAFDPDRLRAVAGDPAAAGLQALLIARHGHLVLERYGHGVGADSPVDPGFSPLLLALASGVAVQQGALAAPLPYQLQPAPLCQAVGKATRTSYAEFLSQAVWRRLNAARAWLVGPPGDCAVAARPGDWLRVAMLLDADGRFEDSQIVPAGWVQRLRLAAYAAPGMGLLPGRAAHAVQAPASDDVFFVRGRGRWRIWVVPDRQLVMLFGATSAAAQTTPGVPSWDEMALLNRVLRALPAAGGAGSSPLGGLVPGH